MIINWEGTLGAYVAVTGALIITISGLVSDNAKKVIESF